MGALAVTSPTTPNQTKATHMFNTNVNQTSHSTNRTDRSDYESAPSDSNTAARRVYQPDIQVIDAEPSRLGTTPPPLIEPHEACVFVNIRCEAIDGAHAKLAGRFDPNTMLDAVWAIDLIDMMFEMRNRCHQARELIVIGARMLERHLLSVPRNEERMRQRAILARMIGDARGGGNLEAIFQDRLDAYAAEDRQPVSLDAIQKLLDKMAGSEPIKAKIVKVGAKHEIRVNVEAAPNPMQDEPWHRREPMCFASVDARDNTALLRMVSHCYQEWRASIAEKVRDGRYRMTDAD